METKITYTKQGDYLLPDLKLPEQPTVEIGIWGKRYLKYIEHYRPILYTNLLTSCKLTAHLADIDGQAENFFCSIIIGLLLNMFFENLCFFFVFRILRKFSGGYHSNKYSTCLLSSLIINIAILILLKTIYYNPNLWINLIVILYLF